MVKRLISSYYQIVRTKIQDLVPKVIMDDMINLIKKTVQSELIKKLYKEENLDELLEESEEIELRRKTTSDMLKVWVSVVLPLLFILLISFLGFETCR